MYKETVEIEQLRKILGLGNTKKKFGFLLGMLGFVKHKEKIWFSSGNAWFCKIPTNGVD